MDKDKACFLCYPDTELVYRQAGNGFALCGIGPIVPGYSVVSTNNHVRSAADINRDQVKGFIEFVIDTREKLTSLFGQCILSEHGRLPVCQGESGLTDPHCYHAHFLMFPGVPFIDNDNVASNFSLVEECESLNKSLALAQAHKEYFLFSPHPQKFLVMSEPRNFMRQFARLVVGESLGSPELADWRKFPNLHEVKSTASHLRTEFLEMKSP